MNRIRVSLTGLLLFSLIFMSCQGDVGKAETDGNDDTWRQLFNGQNLDGWTAKFHHHESGENFANTFRVVDGVIQVNYDDYSAFDNRYGHLFFDEPYSSFHLKFHYRFTDQWM